jgi:HEPN domain-containing protein
MAGVIFKKQMKKIFKKEDGYRSSDLMQFGLHHYSAASVLLNGHPFHYDSGGYLLHLSFELLFKSWILYETGKFGATHSLKALRQQITKLEPKFLLSKQENRILDHLDKLYGLRYPNRAKPTEIGSDEISFSKNIISKVLEYSPEGLKKELKSIPNNEKGGRILLMRPIENPIDIDLLIKQLI